MKDGEPVPALIWCPFPDVASAEAAASVLLDEGLIACANILPETRSLFLWRGERQSGGEVGTLLKTNARQLAATIARLEALHPYDEPAVVGWHCDAAAPGTAAWLGSLGA